MTDSRFDTVVLISDAFPYGVVTERTFIEPEIKPLSEVFRRVIILPTIEKEPISTHLRLPDNVEICRAWLDSKECNQRWRRLPMGLEAYRYAKGGPTIAGMKQAAASMAMARCLRRWIRQENIDLGRTLFYAFWFDIGALALGILRKSLPIKYIASCHGHDIYTRRAQRLRRLALSNSVALYAVSQHGRDAVAADFPDLQEKIRLRTLGTSDTRSIATPNPDPRKELTFISVSQVIPRKRVEKIFEMMKALAVGRESTEIEWIHIGDGSSMGALRELVAADLPHNLTIKLLGEMQNAEIHRFYATEKIDWFIHMSRQEGGNTIAIAEALSHGVPVVAADYGGLDEMVTDDCGVIFPCDVEREEFVRGMLPYIESDFRHRAMSEAARRRWEEYFDAERLRREFVNEIARL